jgi:hypothetical protein
VFISYPHGALGYVRELADWLAQRQIPVWWDHQLSSGQEWHRVIQGQVDSCTAMIVVMTPEGDSSQWMSREINHAESAGKPIYPLLLEGEGFFRLNNLQHEDVTGGRMPSEGFAVRLASGDLSAGAVVTATARRQARARRRLYQVGGAAAAVVAVIVAVVLAVNFANRDRQGSGDHSNVGLGTPTITGPGGDGSPSSSDPGPGGGGQTAAPNTACGETLFASRTINTSLTCTGNALTIATPGIVIDLGGHTITGDGTGSGITLNDGADAVTIRNGTITKFGNGVYVFSSDNVKISDLVLKGDNIGLSIKASSGLQLTGGELSGSTSAVKLDTAPSTNLKNVTISASVTAVESNYLGVSGSTITSKIYASESDMVVISGNTFNGGGVSYTTQSRNGQVRLNTFNGGDTQVFLGDAPSALIDQNTFNGGKIGLQVEVTNIGTVSGTKITGNTFTNEQVVGAFINSLNGTASTQIRVENNTFSHNGYAAGTQTDKAGNAVHGGLHIMLPAGANVWVGNNHGTDNNQRAIWAAAGSVTDGGGNTYHGDSCTGVACTMGS